MNEVLERRLEFLKLEAKGLSLCELVKVLSEKYHTSERNIYYDAETRNTWQPVLTQLFDLDKARLMLINRYDFLYRQASYHFQIASNSLKPIYLSRMIEATERLVHLLGLESLRDKQETEKLGAEAEKMLAKNKTITEALAALQVQS